MCKSKKTDRRKEANRGGTEYSGHRPWRNRKKIRNMLTYAAPERILYDLSEIVQEDIKPRSNDPVSVVIYAELCGVSLAEMKRRFKERGDWPYFAKIKVSI